MLSKNSSSQNFLFKFCLKVPATASVLTEPDESFSQSESLPPSPTPTESESRSWNILLLMASQSKVSTNTCVHTVWSFCTALPGMTSLDHQNWTLSECALLPTSRFLCIRKVQQECNATKLANQWLLMSCLDTSTMLFHGGKVVEHFANYLFQLLTHCPFFMT